jgi:P pilus assembly chaperone PapD
MTRRCCTAIGSTALVLASALLWPTAAAAQVSVEASPLRIEIQAWPGATNTQAVTLTNVSRERVRVRAILSDWHLSRDGAPQFEEPVSGRAYAAAAWVRFAPPELVIEGNGQGTVRFTVTVPRDAEPAGYRTGLLFDFTPEERDVATRAKQVTVRSRIATLIYLHVQAGGPRAQGDQSGHPPASVELTDLRVLAGAEETQVVATLRNSSRRSVRTKGALLLYDRTGLAIREVQVPDVPVLPESEREMAVPIGSPAAAGDAQRPLPPGDYRVELKLDVGQRALIVGETTLKVER